jgi:hypothetical protein
VEGQGSLSAVFQMVTVHDLLLEAQKMKSENASSHQILEHLIKRIHEIGRTPIDTVTDGEKYELIFKDASEKISFDGTDYHFDRS